jgi:PadR family transcriptional regulator AphA
MSSDDRTLTTTSYAILGLLAIRPWSTYELAAQMQRNLHYFWPRAESNLYAEPKRLVEGGYAQAQSEPVGKRRRTVYTITPKGRRTVEAWLRQPAAALRLESETLVKLMFAPFGTKQDMLRHLRDLLGELETRRQHLRSIFHEFTEGTDPFPDRIHVNILCYRLIWDYNQAAAHWAEWALETIGRWPDTTSSPDREQAMGGLKEALLAVE